jgi:hypothetical protein
MAISTHRQYFRRYRLSAAQYGEILVAEAFHGRKLGDSQPCYDVVTNAGKIADALRGAGVHFDVSSDRQAEVRIQVRSKLSESRSGKASVVHCKATDLEGSKRHAGMTHLVVILVHPGDRFGGADGALEGTVQRAWLIPHDAAASLRRKDGAVQYIAVSQLSRDAITAGVVDVTRLLAAAADAPLS